MISRPRGRVQVSCAPKPLVAQCTLQGQLVEDQPDPNEIRIDGITAMCRGIEQDRRPGETACERPARPGPKSPPSSPCTISPRPNAAPERAPDIADRLFARTGFAEPVQRYPRSLAECQPALRRLEAEDSDGHDRPVTEQQRTGGRPGRQVEVETCAVRLSMRFTAPGLDPGPACGGQARGPDRVSGRGCAGSGMALSYLWILTKRSRMRSRSSTVHSRDTGWQRRRVIAAAAISFENSAARHIGPLATRS